jgi:hypothetical protein
MAESIPIGNPVLIHCIRLLTYLHGANETYDRLMQSGDSPLSTQSALQIPTEMRAIACRTTRDKENKLRANASVKPNEPNDPHPTVQLSSESINLLVKRFVVLILSSRDIGSSSEASIDLLTDVFVTFMQKLTRLLRVHSDTEEYKTFSTGTGNNETLNDFQRDQGQASRPFRGDVAFEMIEKTLDNAGYSIPSLRYFEKQQRAYRDHLLSQAHRLRQKIANQSALSAAQVRPTTNDRKALP